MRGKGPPLAGLLLVAVAVLVAAGCGGSPGAQTATGVITPGAPTRIPKAPASKVLAIGLDEPDAPLLQPLPANTQASGAVENARAELTALHPTYYRLRVDWAQVQPSRGSPPDWTVAVQGCRNVEPCLSYAGVQAQLEAVRAQQRQSPGTFQVVVVLTDAPGWATGRPHGCRRGRASTAPTHLGAYRRLVRSLLSLGRTVGVKLPWWSAWDEPNHPEFLRPQRCHGRLVSAGVYADLVRSLESALGSAPGAQRVILGDAAGIPATTATATSPVDFIAALPEDVACASDVWAEHGYVVPGASLPIGRGGASLDRVITALDAHVCDRRKLVWMTETGVGATHSGEARGTTEQELSDQCDAMANALQTWFQSPRVDAAFQYTFREDPAFQVGLVSPDLQTTFPTYDLWKAWSDRKPADPGPLDTGCP